jgi:hypothetical protein
MSWFVDRSLFAEALNNMTAAQASAKLASRLLLTDRWKEMPEPLTRKWHWSNDLTKGRVQLHVSAAGKLQHTHLISLCALLLQSESSALLLLGCMVLD